MADDAIERGEFRKMDVVPRQIGEKLSCQKKSPDVLYTSGLQDAALNGRNLNNGFRPNDRSDAFQTHPIYST